MTYLARIPQEFAQLLKANPTKSVGTKSQQSYTALETAIVTKARDLLNYSPYLPAAGLYSLLSDSFGPVP